ncbi:MAG: tetratricopeptide repeat protein [Pirellulaceae bacterium]|nr:tetratricopeptide repeat protein [Pirellulaceae bacterium]
MRNRILLVVAILATINAVMTAQRVPAEEPARAFLSGLRARGFYDTALEYLDQMQSSRLAPAELRDSIAFEKSLLLIEVSRTQREPSVRAKQIDQAQQLLQQFIDTNSSSPKANAARSQLGSLIVERARMKAEESKKRDRQTLQKESLALYEQSFVVFDELQAQVDKQLSAIPKVLDTRDRKEAKLIERRKQLRADFLQTELFAAAIREELADMLPPGSSDQTKYLTEAAEMYDGIYKKYRTRLAGLYARMYQGRCNQRLGKTKDALGYFGELLDQPDEPETMLALKAKTLRLAMESWLSPAERKYFEAIKRATRWFDDSPRGKEREPDWLAIRFSLARAYRMQADDARDDEPVNQQFIDRSLAAARTQLELVASESGEFQEPAQKMLAELGAPGVANTGPQIETFDAAAKAAKKALDAVAPATKTLQELTSQFAAAKDPAARASLQERLGEAKTKLDETQNQAIDYYRLAIELADDQTPQSNINLAQYFLCYLYFLKEDYFDAALVGDFVATRYPDSPGARQCAKIAMAAYLKMAERNTDADQEFEIQRLTSVGTYISDTWPNAADTEKSLASLIPVMINAGESMLAADFLQRVPETSAQRGELELMTGQAIWGSYLAGDQQLRQWQQTEIPDDVNLEIRQRELDAMKQSARQILEDGYKRLPEEPSVNTSNATAMLSLAQIHVEDGQFEDAIVVLEHSVIGPLTLVQQSSDAVSNPVFVEETYRTSLRAYVASLADGGADRMAKAKNVMAQMQSALGSDAAGKQRMLGVYVALAQDVQREMKSAAPQSREQMSEVFETFLLELSQGSSELSVLNWVAETFASLGAGFDDGDEPSENAKKYYQQAATAFENLLNQGGLSPQMQTQTKARLASVHARAGDFPAALKLYEEVLVQNPNAMNLQVATARMLQQWAKQDPAKYDDAINGIGAKVWGWLKISLAAAGRAPFRQDFFEARYEISHCQTKLANTKSGPEKAKLLATAQRNLAKTARLYPTLGGKESYDKYDVLLKQIQTEQGNQPSGLEALGLIQPKTER